MLRIGALLGAATLCSGHVAMNYPPSWLDTDGKYGLKDGPYDGNGQLDWRDAGCIAKTGRGGGSGTQSDAKHCIMKWYTNNTFIPGKRTLPDNMRAYDPILNEKNPWYAPGTAPVHGPCGVDGGNPTGCPAGNLNPADVFACGGGGRGLGDDGRTLKYSYAKVTEWKVGEEVEIAYGVEANHAGGYQYRLCPKPADLMDLSEECFQKTPLTLSDKAYVQYNGDKNNRTAFTPLRTTVGTTPAGSQWSRQAIPDCKGADGGVVDFGCRNGAQFPAPAENVYGFWGVYNLGTKFLGMGKIHSYSIVDMLKVPDVPKGVYVLSMRYDGEQTSQVWNTCADIEIV